MNKIFKLKHKSGPHGDACSTYDIIFLNENVKLYEFLEDIDPNEWGTIHFKVLNPLTAKLDYSTEDERYDELRAEYNYDKFKTKEDEITCQPYLNKNIDLDYHSWANGGWGCMNYWIKLKN